MATQKDSTSDSEQPVLSVHEFQRRMDALLRPTPRPDPWEYPPTRLAKRKGYEAETKEERRSRRAEERQERILLTAGEMSEIDPVPDGALPPMREDETQGNEEYPDLHLYRLRQQLAGERGRILRFARPLAHYDALQDLFAQARGELRSVGYVPGGGDGNPVQRQACYLAHQSLRLRLVERIWRQYQGIWEKAIADLALPEPLLREAISRAVDVKYIPGKEYANQWPEVQGSWNEAVAYLDQIPEIVAEARPSLRMDVAATLAPPWLTAEVAATTIQDAFEATRPHPGRRRPGGQETDWAAQLALFQPWWRWRQKHSDGTPTDFADELVHVCSLRGSEEEEKGWDHQQHAGAFITSCDLERLRRAWPAPFNEKAVGRTAILNKLTAAKWLHPIEGVIEAYTADFHATSKELR